MSSTRTSRRKGSTKSTTSGSSYQNHGDAIYSSDASFVASSWTSPSSSRYDQTKDESIDYDYICDDEEEEANNKLPEQELDDLVERCRGVSFASRTSEESFASTDDDEDFFINSADLDSMFGDDENSIPVLPAYRQEVSDYHIEPSSPHDFARMFPTLNKMSIRHDDFSPDGNMNLRVDTLVPMRRTLNHHLFHLRMYDLAKREFSLRRYSRDSGRQVCSAKRKYDDEMDANLASSRPKMIQRMGTSALRALRPDVKRFSSAAVARTKRPDTLHSYASSLVDDDDDEEDDQFDATNHFTSSVTSVSSPQRVRPRATNTIKLEFSNYARVDVTRHGGKSSTSSKVYYDLDWWGKHYIWRRVVDKHLGDVSFHLVCATGGSDAVTLAHVVPETRSSTQKKNDEKSGGWVPRCHFWFEDESIIGDGSGLADVIMATALIALVDDCIITRWPPVTSTKALGTSTSDAPRKPSIAGRRPSNVMKRMFSSRRSTKSAGSSISSSSLSPGKHGSSPLRHE